MTGPDPDGGWQRLHPLTPLLRGGRTFGLILGVLGVQQGPQAARALAAAPAPIALAVAALAFVVVFAVAYVAWRTSRYRVEGGDLRLETGVLFRRSRRVPLARLQAVDVVRPLVARVLGLAELRLEVVGGSSSEAPLAYLSEPDAQSLRARLLALSAGSDTAGPPAPEQVLVAVPPHALVVSVLLEWTTVLAVVFTLGMVVAAVVNPAGPIVLVGVVPVLLGMASPAARRLLTEYGFTVAESPDGLRLRHGLLETRSQTVPPGRVQAVTLVQPVLWRRRDWVRVEVDVAGYDSGARTGTLATALLPVAPRELAEQVAGRVLGTDLGALRFGGVPRRARWRAPVQHARLGVAVDPVVIAARRGRLHRVLDVVPHAKVQSLRVTAGPWQRRLRLATVHVDTPGHRIQCRAAQRDVADALALLEAESGRARRARRPLGAAAAPLGDTFR